MLKNALNNTLPPEETVNKNVKGWPKGASLSLLEPFIHPDLNIINTATWRVYAYSMRELLFTVTV